jgi:structural maintenance of chromosome 1
VFRSVNVTNRKASVSVLAVSERQALEMLSRDEKTASRTLTQVRDKDEELQRNQKRLRADEQTQKASKSEVPFLEFNVSHLLTVFSKLEDKLATLQGEHARSKQEYENQQSERTRIRYFCLLQVLFTCHFTIIAQPS